MRQYIFITIFFVAMFFTLDNSGQAISSGGVESTSSYGESALMAHRIDNIHVNHYFDLSAVTNWPDELNDFYSKRNYKLAWIKGGTLRSSAEKFIEALKNAPAEGFPDDYYQSLPISDAYAEMMNNPGFMKFFPYKIVQFDILLTQNFMKYSSDLSNGLIKSQDLGIVWQTHPSKQNFVEALTEAIESNEIAQALQKFKPVTPQYRKLVAARKKLEEQKLNGGWPLPGQFSKLEENDSSKNVIKLKRYLVATGDLNYSDSIYLNSPTFDYRLTEAVKSFQGRHGLEEDGIAGKNTLREMNQPVEYRLGQITINLDRLRHEAENPHDRFIEINIPDYSLEYYEDGEIAEQMNVVVGKIENNTPFLQDTINHIVINPRWNVPWSIATKEMLPQIKRDPGYLARNNYVLVKGSYISDNFVDPYSVDWSEITRRNFPFFIVQQPGNSNALGRIKFMLPNNYSIYLHDTPATHLFSRAQRDFSHGCIRLEKPFELAYKLLEGEMTRNEIRDILVSRRTKTIMLAKKVPVHIHYHTAWVDSAGIMQFRNDVYEFDKISLAVLNK